MPTVTTKLNNRTEPTSIIEWAELMVEITGCPVIPTNDKKQTHRKVEKNYGTDPQQLDWSRANGYGIIPAGRITIVDYDTYDINTIKEFHKSIGTYPADTFAVETPRGYHLYFNGAATELNATYLPDFPVQVITGDSHKYACGPGSYHQASGLYYRVANSLDTPIAHIDDWSSYVGGSTSIREVYQDLTGNRLVGRGEVLARCPNPEHPDRKPSFGVNTNTEKFQCFSCGLAGQGYDMLAMQCDPEKRQRVKAVMTKFMEPTKKPSTLAITPELRAIEAFAHSRMLSAHSVLGHLIGRIFSNIDYKWKIPPIVGSPTTINGFQAVVGGSGFGKTASENAAIDLLNRKDNILTNELFAINSGEYLLNTHFIELKDPKTKKIEYRRSPKRNTYISVDEFKQIVESAARGANTTFSILRSMWSSSNVGAGAIAAGHGRKLEKGDYSLSMTVNCQYEVAYLLSKMKEAGDAQRFLWFSAVDEDIPYSTQVLEVPQLNINTWDAPSQDTEVEVCPEAVELVRKTRHQIMTGKYKGPASDQHKLLIRLRLAVALAALHGYPEPKVDPDMWYLACKFVEWSDYTLGIAKAEGRKLNQKESRKIGHRKGQIKQYENEFNESKEDYIEEAITKIYAKFADRELVRGDIGRSLRGDMRKDYAGKFGTKLATDIFNRLKKSGRIEQKGNNKWQLKN